LRLWRRKRRPGTAIVRSTRTVSRGSTSGLERVSARHNPYLAEIATLKREQVGAGLVASGDMVRHGEANYLRRLIQPWQIRSFGYYDLLGEIKYAATFYSRALANLLLFVSERDENGEVSGEPTTNPQALGALARIRDPGGGGRTGLLSDYGKLMFLVGEALLFVSENTDTQMEQWEMLSTDELRVLDGSITRFRAPSLPATNFRPVPDNGFLPVGQTLDKKGNPVGQYDKTAVVYRLWKRHPRFSMYPDATMEGILDLCEELVLLTQAVRARARSRLAGSGILFIDDRITSRPDEPVPDEDVLEDPFLADLTEALMLPIMEEGTAAAVVPLLARVRVPDGMSLQDLVYHLQIIDPTQLYPETGLRMECIKRMAIGLDMPPEILLGLQDSNHWSAWQIDEQVWKAHLQPVANHLVQDLTSAYLGPYLKDLGLPDWDKYVIAYDATAIINHPDRVSDAKDLYALDVVGKATVREAAGFTDDDAPTEAERAERIGILTHDSTLAWSAEPGVKPGGVLTGPGQIVSPGAPGVPATPGAEPAGPTTGGEVEPGPPPGGPSAPPDVVPTTASAIILVAQIEGAAQLGLLRAREAAGARLLTACRRDSEATRQIGSHRARDVAAALGKQKVRELLNGAREDTLVVGAREVILDALRVFGLEDESMRVIVADSIERDALRTLYDLKPSPLPPEFSQMVSKLLQT
jgi:hypothetical protein